MQMSLAVVDTTTLASATGVSAPVPWWSFTKTAIAAGALVLVRDGRLALDAPLPGRSYNLRQLLQHRAGVANYGDLPAYHEAVARGDHPWTVPELIERTQADKLRFEPGKGWSYSNIGYLLVRQLIETTCQESLGVALARLVIRPLGIQSARLAQTPDDLAGVFMGDAASYHPGWVFHGLLVGELGDAALLLARLMAGTLLPDRLLADMRSGHALGSPWIAPGYGLGLVTGMTARGTRVAGHTGKGPGSVIAVYRALAEGPPVTAAAFSTGDDPASVEHAVFAALAG